MNRLTRILHIAFLSGAALAFSAAVSRAQSGPFTNSLGMKFVPIPGTNILMCTTDTTVEQYKAVGMVSWLTYWGSSFRQGPTHPEVDVSWNEAQAWCRSLSNKEGKKYRLPTDGEWSAAVGPGLYPWGSQWPPPNNCGNYAGQELRTISQADAEKFFAKGFNLIKGFSDHHPFTSPVGSYPANRYGLYDMGGNVSEWCEDEYRARMNSAEAIKAFPALKDEKMPDGTRLRVLRGGSWCDSQDLLLRSSFRGRNHPALRVISGGFRCVVVVSGG